MASSRHPIYGDLVYQREFDATQAWYLVDGNAQLATVEWYIDDGATPEQIISRMAPWHRGTTPVEAIEKIAAARRAFWEGQQGGKDTSRRD